MATQKLTFRINPRALASQTVRGFSYSLCSGFTGYSPSDTTSARSPLAVLFCSAPPLGCGSVHVLDGSFARFCVSENVRVPLRYSGQPLHRKIIASRSPNTPWFCLSNRFFVNSNQAIDYKSIYADSWDPKITNRIKTRAFASKLCAHFYLAIFGFAAWRQQSCEKGSVRVLRFWYMPSRGRPPKCRFGAEQKEANQIESRQDSILAWMIF